MLASVSSKTDLDYFASDHFTTNHQPMLVGVVRQSWKDAWLCRQQYQTNYNNDNKVSNQDIKFYEGCYKNWKNLNGLPFEEDNKEYWADREPDGVGGPGWQQQSNESEGTVVLEEGQLSMVAYLNGDGEGRLFDASLDSQFSFAMARCCNEQTQCFTTTNHHLLKG
ncbi:hypothetical protein ACA910_001311 [Epithemia clementina (nom. ined.)]